MSIFWRRSIVAFQLIGTDLPIKVSTTAFGDLVESPIPVVILQKVAVVQFSKSTPDVGESVFDVCLYCRWTRYERPVYFVQ